MTEQAPLHCPAKGFRVLEMYRRFKFEGSIHESLECVPLAVRRKLDLAGLKISLAGWQAFTHAERVALCHLAVDSETDLAIYQAVLGGFADRVGVPLAPLPDTASDPGPWRTTGVPETLRRRLESLTVELSDARWSRLDDEERYALVKLAEPKRTPEKLRELLAELGVLPPMDGPLPVGRAICVPAPAQPARSTDG